MMRWLQSSWATALFGCVIYLAVTAALMGPGKFQGLRAVLEQAKTSALPEGPSWKYRNPEFDHWLEELTRQREALALREQQLQELQTRLQAERQELNNATQTVARLQADFDRNVVRIKDQEVDNLKRQAKVLSGMSPDGAAVVLREMADDEAVRILVTMKADEASVILEAFSKTGKAEARRAAAFTEKMRRALPPESATRARNPS
jgi:flagellar motility protein MotE (MotC chaperone)